MGAIQTITVLGCGGFIGSHLLERLLDSGRFDVIGIDRSKGKIEHLLGHPRLTFIRNDIHYEKTTRRCIERSDAVISLAALCNPALYNTRAIEVIESNFMLPYSIVKWCAEENKWLIHFSTSEVYGKTVHTAAGGSGDRYGDPPVFFEDTTPLVLGPIRAQRWSYACAKQLLERMIYAFGREQELKFTIVRPFNFIGPRMDFIPGIDGDGIPRVLACFMEALIFGKPLQLVDGGKNRRVFTYIDDAVEAVMRILACPGPAAGQIFNIGNPDNELTIAELAQVMVDVYREIKPEGGEEPGPIVSVASERFYGPGYEDSDRRIPDITKARALLGWLPIVDLRTALRETMSAYISRYSSLHVEQAAGAL